MKFVRSVVAGLALILFSLSVGVAQETCKRNIEPLGGFSLCVPDGWSVQAREGEKFKMIFGPAAETFTANINIKNENSTFSLPDYAGASIKTVLANTVGATSIKLVRWTDFSSTSGLAADRAVFEVEYKGLQITSIQYYFVAGSNKKFVLTGTCLLKDKDAFENLIERAAKSFRLE
ncbi:MAG: hypothetical protein QOE96_3485 [Blastocatellia bacterium]|jgi:hypothetical protein|nr:hypothetical protein [Blastocatellia bacterium]